MLVGGNGARLLGAAGELADIVGLQGLGRTLEDGHRHEVKWTASHLDDQIAQVRAGAGDRFADLELNALVQVFSITDDREAGLREITDPWPTLSIEDASVIPYLMVGSIDEIVGHVHACRERWGITYFVVRALDEFAPILDAFVVVERSLRTRVRKMFTRIAHSDAIAARASTVLQLRDVPVFALSSRVTATASLLRPMPFGSDR